MGDLIGDSAFLHQNRVPFHAVYSARGASGSGSFLLTTAAGVKHLLSARASVKVVSDKLTCQVIGPAAADKAVEAFVAVVPATAADGELPTTIEEIMTIGGSSYLQHSLYVPSTIVPLSFAQEVAHQIKPSPLIGEPPLVVFAYNVTGGVPGSIVRFRISGVLEVDGIGFAKSW